MALKGQDRPTIPIRAFGVKCVLEQKGFFVLEKESPTWDLHMALARPVAALRSGTGLPAAELGQEGLEQPHVGSGQAEQSSQISDPKLGDLGVTGNRLWACTASGVAPFYTN